MLTTLRVILGKGGVGGKQSLKDGKGSLAKNTLMPKDQSAGPLPSVCGHLLLIAWARVCWSLLGADLRP